MHEQLGAPVDGGSSQLARRPATAEDSGLLPGSVDLVLLCQVDHYLRDRAAYLLRLRTTLRPHGRIALLNYARYLAADRDAATAAG
ncbi:methyltransferase domain-containing protein, partial [Lacticaseibacillus rhamnosus]